MELGGSQYSGKANNEPDGLVLFPLNRVRIGHKSLSRNPYATYSVGRIGSQEVSRLNLVRIQESPPADQQCG
jgi:hypothetical protein